MTRQTNSPMCLGESPAGLHLSRLCALAVAATLIAAGAAAGFGQAQPDAAKPVPTEHISHGYLAHQSIEVGGRITSTSGSSAMWDTLVNQSSGGRVLGQSLELHSVNPSKTPFFDSLSSYSTGYGGDPIDVTRLKISKGRLYDFSGSFRRNREYFDYNLLANSLLTNYTATTPVLVPQPDSLHAFNTVRRNMDTNLTLMPLSRVSYRIAFNHNTNEGPTYSTVHNAGDVQVLNWVRNGSDTYSAGVDANLAKRTTLSYDQFFIFNKGDSSFHMPGLNSPAGVAELFPLSSGTLASLGVEALGGTTTCGSATAKPVSTLGPNVSSSGILNPYCTGTIQQSQSAPTRTHLPTEQLRFISHYWDRVSFNGRVLYSGDTSTINSFALLFNGLSSNRRQTLETGNGANGQFALNRRINTSGDFGMVAELTKSLSISEAFSFWNTRTSGSQNALTQTWTGSAGTSGPPVVPTTSMLTPLTDPSITITSASSTGSGYLNQKVAQNTILATVIIAPQIKVSGGWQYKDRVINDPHATDMTWHENGLLLGTVIQPSRVVRININYDSMSSQYASGSAVLGEPSTPLALPSSNTFTRIAPNTSYHLRARATVKPAKWINFAVTGNDYSAKNDDPQVNHAEHNRDFSFATSIMPREGLSIDFNYARDDVLAQTDLCYIFTANANAPLPSGAANSGTCVKTTANPEGATTLYLGTGYYHAPSYFIAGSVNYAPSKYWRVNGGIRLNNVNGQAEMLNPLMAPGALQSQYATPFADLQINIAQGWAWHGNWTHNGYSEQGPQGPLPARNTSGDILTLGVKYAF